MIKNFDLQTYCFNYSDHYKTSHLIIAMPLKNYYDYILKQQNMFQGIYNNLVILIIIHQKINLFNDQTMFRTLLMHQNSSKIMLDQKKLFTSAPKECFNTIISCCQN